MPKFSESSLRKLATCHPDLQILFKEVIKDFDCTILVGNRNKQDQDLAFKDGKSKLQFPNSKHNGLPSLAVDVAPYPIDWNDISRFYYFSGFVMGKAALLYEEKIMKYKVRWGGDWNNNTQVKDNSFNDLVHFELLI